MFARYLGLITYTEVRDRITVDEVRVREVARPAACVIDIQVERQARDYRDV
jgi:hypothetical protein